MKNQMVREKVRSLIAQKAGVDPREVTDDMFFEDDLNLSDLELTEILEELEDNLKLELLIEQENLTSVRDLMDLLEERLE